MSYCASRTVLRMRLTVGVCGVLCCVRLAPGTRRTPTQTHSQQRTLTQNDMLPQHPVNIRKLTLWNLTTLI